MGRRIIGNFSVSLILKKKGPTNIIRYVFSFIETNILEMNCFFIHMYKERRGREGDTDTVEGCFIIKQQVELGTYNELSFPHFLF